MHMVTMHRMATSTGTTTILYHKIPQAKSLGSVGRMLQKMTCLVPLVREGMLQPVQVLFEMLDPFSSLFPRFHILGKSLKRRMRYIPRIEQTSYISQTTFVPSYPSRWTYRPLGTPGRLSLLALSIVLCPSDIFHI